MYTEEENIKSWEKYAAPIFETLEKESDRGSVLVGAAYLDNILEKILKFRLNSKDDKTKIVDELFKFDSPLGSFSSKIKMSYCLELISKDAYCDFETIRKIRNACAHSSDNIFFGSKDVIQYSVNLKGWEKSINTNTDEEKETLKKLITSKSDSQDFLRFREKTRFIMTLSYWFGYLMSWIEQIDKANELKAENKSLKEELGRIVKKSIELGLEIPDDVMESVKKYKLI